MRANCSAPKMPALPRRPSTWRRHRLDGLEQLLERGAAAGVAQRELVLGVVEVDVHPERLGHHRELRADVAVADDAELAPAHLVAADRRLVPDPGVHGPVLLGQLAPHRDDLGDGQLDDRAGVGEGRVEDRDALGRGGGQVDLVGADAEGADRRQVRVGVDDPLGDDRLRADAQQVDVGEGGEELVLVHRPRAGLDLVAGVCEDLRGQGMQVLEQQGAHTETVVARRARLLDARNAMDIEVVRGDITRLDVDADRQRRQQPDARRRGSRRRHPRRRRARAARRVRRALPRRAGHRRRRVDHRPPAARALGRARRRPGLRRQSAATGTSSSAATPTLSRWPTSSSRPTGWRPSRWPSRW